MRLMDRTLRTPYCVIRWLCGGLYFSVPNISRKDLFAALRGGTHYTTTVHIRSTCVVPQRRMLLGTVSAIVGLLCSVRSRLCSQPTDRSGNDSNWGVGEERVGV